MKFTDDYLQDIKKALSCIPCFENLYEKSFFITGATGMIGSAIVDTLLVLNKEFNAKIKIIVAGRSYEKVLKRFYCFSEKDGLFYTKYDATFFSEIEVDQKIDYIIHGASNANPAIYMKEPVETIMANILGLENVLRLAKKCESKRLLYISSSEVY